MLIGRIFRGLALVAALTIGSVPLAQADTPLDIGNSVRIEAATGTPAQVDESSRIRFRILNDSPSQIHLMRVETKVAGVARLVARIGEDEYTTLESLGVLPGEVLDLTTSHLWYETGPAIRDLEKGQSFGMTVGFVRGSLTIPVHVH